jgi:hypothetical protein
LLIHSDIVSITTVGCIRIGGAIVLGVLRSIISSVSRAVHGSRCWAIRSTARAGSVTAIATMGTTMGTTMRAAVGMVAVAATIVSVASVSVTSIAVTAVARWTALELLILFLDIGDQVLAKLPCLFNHIGIRSSNVEEHVLIALVVCGCFEISGSPALDLHTAPCFLLDVLYISTAVSNDLSTQVETMDRLQTDRNLLLGPFASSKLVTFDLFLVSAAEASFVNKLGEFLLDKLVDLGDSRL